LRGHLRGRWDDILQGVGQCLEIICSDVFHHSTSSVLARIRRDIFLDISTIVPLQEIPSSVELILAPIPIPVTSRVRASVGLIAIISMVAVDPIGRAERGRG
jgi:hypothetical protein